MPVPPVDRTLPLADEDATRALGAALGAAAEDGDVIALHGDLGAGKTCLAQGLARGLGVLDTRAVNSPTFALWNTHLGRHTLHHMDWYRIGDADEALALGLDDALGVDGICVVEWASRLADYLPADTLHVHLTRPASGAAGRLARLVATGPRSRRLLAAAP